MTKQVILNQGRHNMVLSNNKLLTALCYLLLMLSLVLSPSYAENRYIFPDEVINGQAKPYQYNSGFSAQQRYWVYPQYVSDYDKKKQAIQYTQPTSVRHKIRYPGNYQKYTNNTATGNLLYPGDLVSKKQNYIKSDKNRDYKVLPSYPETPDNHKYSEKYLNRPKYKQQHDRYNDEHYKKSNDRQTGTQYIVGYKYIAVPVYSVQRSFVDRDNLPEMISADSSYKPFYKDRNNKIRTSQYYSPEQYGVFSAEVDPYSLSPQQHNDFLDLEHLFPQLGSINSDL